ncbi:BTB/POZ domain-containing protein 5 [Elsinoe australis]|uniref:BTB/POZ domain-containing protein 5 n=1 Tax=Elsinoe australis TaxID=40998 RepID=A0A4U7BA42_9PEZI|nr:BTB/POZ domain-containing protein 5 [Elsinoe australis]
MVLHNLEHGRISNITIVVSGRQIKVHRLVLASQSPYFEALGKFQDVSLPEVELIGDDPDDVHVIITHMYTENIDWSAEDIRSEKRPVPVGLMVIADKYHFENLVGKVTA